MGMSAKERVVRRHRMERRTCPGTWLLPAEGDSGTSSYGAAADTSHLQAGGRRDSPPRRALSVMRLFLLQRPSAAGLANIAIFNNVGLFFDYSIFLSCLLTRG